MAEIFQERDSLLSVQANVPIYYWLVRKHADRHAHLIRSFLEHFEEERAKVRAQSRARSKGEQVEISDQI